MATYPFDADHPFGTLQSLADGLDAYSNDLAARAEGNREAAYRADTAYATEVQVRSALLNDHAAGIYADVARDLREGIAFAQRQLALQAEIDSTEKD